MVKKAKPRSRIDALIDGIRSEVTAGNAGMNAWLKHLESVGGIESLFELETWIRGLQSFFDPRYLALKESERARLGERSFHQEIEVVRLVLQRCERLAREVASRGQPETIRFETLLERKSQRGTIPGFNLDPVFEQPTPVDSLAILEESLRDIRLLTCAVRDGAGVDYPLYRSLGRQYAGGLKSCRFLDILLSQGIRRQYDQMENPFLRGILDGIKDQRLRRNTALSFLYLHRLLKYLALAGRELEQDQPLREVLVIFSLLSQEMGRVGDFLKARFLKGREIPRALRDAAELVIYSLHIEGRRAQEQELPGLASEPDVAAVYSRIQNSHGLLRNCLQSGVAALAQALNNRVDARTIFPSMMDSADKAQLLRRDLWELRAFLKEMLEIRPEPALNEIVLRMSMFREKSLPLLMYRDWEDFENFSDAIVTAGSIMESRILLRKFISYVETLIQEVSKRSSFIQGGRLGASGQ